MKPLTPGEKKKKRTMLTASFFNWSFIPACPTIGKLSITNTKAPTKLIDSNLTKYS